MSLKDTCKNLRTLLVNVTSDLDKAEAGNKAASQRVRTGTIKMEKLAKLFRKESIKSEKTGGLKKKKPAAAPSKASPKPSAVAKLVSAKSGVTKKSTGKVKTLKKAKAKPLAKKKPTAKILKKVKR